MQTTRKNLCWVLVLVMFCVVSCGGCGGSSSNDEQNGRTDTLENPVNPAPNTPEDNGGSNNTVFDINGMWRLETGTWHINIPGVYNYTYPYVEGSASAALFMISVSKNAKDEYYTLKLAGEGVATNNEGNAILPDNVMTQWEVTFKCRNDDVPSTVSHEIEQGIYGSDKFKHPDSNYYMCNFYNGVILGYTVIDDSTITYRLNLATASGPDSNYGEFTLKRVN